LFLHDGRQGHPVRVYFPQRPAPQGRRRQAAFGPQRQLDAPTPRQRLAPAAPGGVQGGDETVVERTHRSKFPRSRDYQPVMAIVATRVDFSQELAKRILLSKIKLLRINLFR
jgi:hypothetical protein